MNHDYTHFLDLKVYSHPNGRFTMTWPDGGAEVGADGRIAALRRDPHMSVGHRRIYNLVPDLLPQPAIDVAMEMAHDHCTQPSGKVITSRTLLRDWLNCRPTVANLDERQHGLPVHCETMPKLGAVVYQDPPSGRRRILAIVNGLSRAEVLQMFR